MRYGRRSHFDLINRMVEKNLIRTRSKKIKKPHTREKICSGLVKRGHLRRVLADQKHVLDYGLTSTDLLVARRSLTFDVAAKICGVPLSDEPLLFESSFIRLTPKLDVVRTVFLLNYLNSESTRKAYVLSRISGITISGINQAAMNQIPVMLSPVPLQNNFVSKVNEVRSIQSQQFTATAKAKAAFDALLSGVFK